MNRDYVLDAGALIAADRGDPRLWELLDIAERQGDSISVPAPALAQAWRSRRQVRLGRLVSSCGVIPLTDRLARLAGELCGRSATNDITDATVVVTAAAVGAAIWTSDPDDLAVLVAHLPRGTPSVALRRVP